MFTYKKIVIAVLAILVAVPTVSMAGSITTSLIQGKTPSEALSILAEQIDLLTGRVATLETKQSDTELEIERLKLENENLRLKTDEVLSGTAETRANEAIRKQCSEIETQIRALEAQKIPIRSSFEVKISSLEKELRNLKTVGNTSIIANPEIQVLLDRLENGEDLGDFTQEEQVKVREYQGQVSDAQIASLNEIREQKEQLEAQINSLELEMEKTIEALPIVPEVEALQNQLNALLCA